MSPRSVTVGAVVSTTFITLVADVLLPDSSVTVYILEYSPTSSSGTDPIKDFVNAVAALSTAT